MSFRQIRKIGGLPSVIKELQEKLARFQADIGIEDISVFWNGRVDTDAVQYSDDHIVNQNMEESTDNLQYSDDPTATLQTSGAFQFTDSSGNADTQPLSWSMGDFGGIN